MLSSIVFGNDNSVEACADSLGFRCFTLACQLALEFSYFVLDVFEVALTVTSLFTVRGELKRHRQDYIWASESSFSILCTRTITQR